MTRQEIRMAAATKKLVKAQYRLKCAEKMAENRVRECREKAMKPVDAARRASRDARAELTALDLAGSGIVPMKTIVKYKGKLYVTMVKHQGWACIIPVKNNGQLYKDAIYLDQPFDLRHIIATERVLVTK